MKTTDTLNDFEQLDNFYVFLRKFNSVKRAIYIPVDHRFENCAEHSFQLSLMCWYFSSLSNINYNVEKILLYSLIHDLVEVYAGDTPVFNTSKKFHSSKQRREQRAFIQICNEFPYAKELHTLMHEYEEQSDDESKLVYAVDKILPLLGNIYDCGRQMEKEGITITQIIEKNVNKISVDANALRYFNYLTLQLHKYAK